jgi:hypothetical protein
MLRRRMAAWALVVCLGGCGGEKASVGPAGASVSDASDLVLCGNGACRISAGEVCCLVDEKGSPICTTSCPAGSDSFSCSGPQNCPGGQCCTGLTAMENSIAQCADQCIWGQSITMCRVSTDCPRNLQCCLLNPGVYPGVRWCSSDC